VGPVMFRRVRLASFDNGVTADVTLQRPDRYRHLEAAWSDGKPRIARGGGYSLAAASFDADSVVQDMRLFDRILAFDAATRTITVEAGLTLGHLLAFTTKSGLWLPPLPGYPDITVGGAIAANVHGKGASQDGTFRHWVKNVTLFHPDRGWSSASAHENAELFEFTLGGFGLSGTIISAQLRLDPLPGGEAWTRMSAVGSLTEGWERLAEGADRNGFVYTWHDAAPRRGSFGKGLLVEGGIVPESPLPHDFVPRYKVLSASATDGRYPFAVWGGARTALINGLYRAASRLRPQERREPLFDALFPFARRHAYFRMYGHTGLIECQLLFPKEAAKTVLTALEEKILQHRPPTVFVSLKAMRGEPQLLRFERDGICMALHMVRNRDGLAFAKVVDDITIENGGLPSLIKDSRLPRSVVEKCHAGIDEFRALRQRQDPNRRYQSELSKRLAL